MRDEGSRVYLRSPIHLHYVDINNSAQKCRPSRASLCTTRPRDASVLACLRPNLEITGRKKKKRAAKQNCLRKKKRKKWRSLSLLPLFSLFLSTWIRFDSLRFGERLFVRNLQIGRNDRYYTYLWRIISRKIQKVYFCNYAIGSRNFSSGII